LALVVVRGLAVCSSPPGFQAGVVQAVRHLSPRSAFARGSGWAARFLWSGWGAKCRPYRGPTGRSSGRGLCIWLRGKFFPPRRLAWPLGTSKKEQGSVGRQVYTAISGTDFNIYFEMPIKLKYKVIHVP